ncbi:MAG: ABC transporter ATP-binding protein, partial [Candidatus Caldarchaeum sp.]
MAEVEVLNVRKSYDGVEALRGVTLSINKNEFFSLLGPSGCGKTTLLRIIAGLERQDEGNVKIGGKIMDDIPPNKRGVGLVFQGTAIFPHLNVFDNIAFGLKMRGLSRGEIRERVKKILELMNMPFEKY